MCCYDSDTELVKILLRNWYSLCMWGDAKPLRSKRIPIRQHAFSYWRVLLPLAIDSYMVILFHFYHLGSDEYLPQCLWPRISLSPKRWHRRRHCTLRDWWKFWIKPVPLLFESIWSHIFVNDESSFYNLEREFVEPFEHFDTMNLAIQSRNPMSFYPLQ